MHTPIAGEQGKDYLIVNYVDWKLIGFQDAFCGSKSYDGHEGTDFTLRSFAQMDSGVNVLAAGSGVVTFIIDSIFDREKVSDISKGLGNYIAIRHPNGYYSYYGHLKKNSALVSIGDTVSAKQKIAQVGSSGNSTDPHLHFELWFDSLFVVDPFKGKCGNDTSLWIEPLEYDSSFNILEQGLYLRNVTINTLRERMESTLIRPYEITNQIGDTLTFWSHMKGVRKNDTLTIRWYDPDNQIYFSYDFPNARDWWYYYFWSYITTENLVPGNWRLEVLRNNSVISTDSFLVKETVITSIKSEQESQESTCNAVKKMQWTELISSFPVEVYDLNGKSILPSSLNSEVRSSTLNPSLYLVKVYTENAICVFKSLR